MKNLAKAPDVAGREDSFLAIIAGVLGVVVELEPIVTAGGGNQASGFPDFAA